MGWRLLTIAGLFDCWTPPGGGEALYTYTVITVDASPNIQSIHDRSTIQIGSIVAFHFLLVQSKSTVLGVMGGCGVISQDACCAGWRGRSKTVVGLWRGEVTGSHEITSVKVLPDLSPRLVVG